MNKRIRFCSCATQMWPNQISPRRIKCRLYSKQSNSTALDVEKFEIRFIYAIVSALNKHTFESMLNESKMESLHKSWYIYRNIFGVLQSVEMPNKLKTNEAPEQNGMKGKRNCQTWNDLGVVSIGIGTHTHKRNHVLQFHFSLKMWTKSKIKAAFRII